jgi:hypothetical protein
MSMPAPNWPRSTRCAPWLSPGLIGAFVLLGLFPLLTKKAGRRGQRRKVYARWKARCAPPASTATWSSSVPAPGGLVSAYIGAAVKAKVTLVESHKMGGDCLNFGCVPSKALIRTAKLRHQMRHSANGTAWRQLAHLQLSRRDGSASSRHRRHRPTTASSATPAWAWTCCRATPDRQPVDGRDRAERRWNPDADHPQHRDRRRRAAARAAAAGPGHVDYVTSDTLWDDFAQLDACPGASSCWVAARSAASCRRPLRAWAPRSRQVEMAPRIMVREDAEVSELARQALQADGVRC